MSYPNIPIHLLTNYQNDLHIYPDQTEAIPHKVGYIQHILHYGCSTKHGIYDTHNDVDAKNNNMNHINRTFAQIALCCFSLFVSSNISALEKQVVMGAGPSTAVITLFFKNFSKTASAKGYSFEVEPRSIKHAGGIAASDKYLFGRTGRPLNQKEKLLNKQEIIIARIPLTMVVGNQVGIKSISLEQLKEILTGNITNWKQLGGKDHKILLVGREDTEVAFTILKNTYDFFKKIDFGKVLTRDHQVANFLKSKKGAYSLSFGAKSNFENNYHLKTSDFEAGVNLGLVYDTGNSKHPLIRSTKAYAKSMQWIDILKDTNFMAPVLY